MIVEFKRNGRHKQMNAKLARLLVKQGHVRIVDVGVETTVSEKPEAVPEVVAVEVPDEGQDLDAMGVEELRALAEVSGLTVHHRAGAERIRELLREQM